MKDYSDILELGHHESDHRQRMEPYKRAAQFAPFSALQGYEEALYEAARLTEEKKLLDEGKIEELNRTLLIIKERIEDTPQVTVTYFVPDEKKSGGSYITITGNVTKMIDDKKVLCLSGVEIPICEIVDILLCSFDAQYDSTYNKDMR